MVIPAWIVECVQLVPSIFLHEDVKHRLPFVEVELIEMVVTVVPLAPTEATGVLADGRPGRGNGNHMMDFKGGFTVAVTTTESAAIQASEALVFFDLAFDRFRKLVFVRSSHTS